MCLAYSGCMAVNVCFMVRIECGWFFIGTEKNWQISMLFLGDRYCLSHGPSMIIDLDLFRFWKDCLLDG